MRCKIGCCVHHAHRPMRRGAPLKRRCRRSGLGLSRVQRSLIVTQPCGSRGRDPLSELANRWLLRRSAPFRAALSTITQVNGRLLRQAAHPEAPVGWASESSSLRSVRSLMLPTEIPIGANRPAALCVATAAVRQVEQTAGSDSRDQDRCRCLCLRDQRLARRSSLRVPDPGRLAPNSGGARPAGGCFFFLTYSVKR
jgi:hypothetical protein